MDQEVSEKLRMNGNNNDQEDVLNGDKEDPVINVSRTLESTVKSRGFSIDHLLNSKSGGKTGGVRNSDGQEDVSAKSNPVDIGANFRFADLAATQSAPATSLDEDVGEEDMVDESDEDEDEDAAIPDEDLHLLNTLSHPHPPPLLIRPTPLSAAANPHSRLGSASSLTEADLLRLSPGSSSADQPSSNPSPGGHHHHHLAAYGPPGSALSPNHMLYSQWLATRNTNALFGLQGKLNCRKKD